MPSRTQLVTFGWIAGVGMLAATAWDGCQPTGMQVLDMLGVDLLSSGTPDLVGTADLRTPPDLSPPPDLVSSPDLTTFPDLQSPVNTCSGLAQLGQAVTATVDPAASPPAATGGTMPTTGTWVLTAVKVYNNGTATMHKATIAFDAPGGSMKYHRQSDPPGGNAETFTASIASYDSGTGLVSYFTSTGGCTSAQGSVALSILSSTSLSLTFGSRVETYTLN